MNETRQTINVPLELTSDQTAYLMGLMKWYMEVDYPESGDKTDKTSEFSFAKRILTKLKRAERKAYADLVK